MPDVFFVIMMLFVILYFSGAFSVVKNRRESSQDDRRTAIRSDARARMRSGPRITPAARAAMRRAQYDSGDAYVRVHDIGLLAYHEADEPRLIRSSRVWTDTDYLRPFAVLWVPHQARGMVRMAIVDGDGRTRYADETRYDLQPGDNTLLPGTWLPLRGLPLAAETWSLRIVVGDTVLAEHAFGWQQAGESLRQYIESDGEISPELQQALTGQGSQAVSLSQLLSKHDE